MTTDLSTLQVLYQDCTLCPRMCHADRRARPGVCGCGAFLTAARAALHLWEEPCLSGQGGSGAVFFSGCTLKCCYCQNYPISQEGLGKVLTQERLEEILLGLQEQGAQNIDLITATQFLPSLLPVLDRIRPHLHIPIVWNCSGYERTETLRILDGYIDIYLPDLKYFSPDTAKKYSGAPDYFSFASKAVKEMIRQTGIPVFASDGSLQKGTLIRHMVLPGQKEDSVRILEWMADSLPKGSFLLSLLSQYTPFFRAKDYPEINRRVTSYEYKKVLDKALALGLNEGFMQERSSAKEEYTPPFDLEGL